MNKIIIEKKLFQLWKELLNLNKFTSNQDFYVLGGSSFLAIQMLYLIKKEIGVELSPSNFLRKPLTINYLTKTLCAIPKKTVVKKLIRETFYQDLQNIKHCQFVWPSYKYKTINSIFLTGASGFVGIHLVESLLKNTDYTIYCLVHSSNIKLAWEKLESAVSFYKLSKLNCKRIKIIIGDLGQKNFGLKQLQYNDLANVVDVIIHAGAVVNFKMSYLDLKSVNIDGTKEIIKFSSVFKSKPIHYISSLAVLGINHTKKVKNIYNENNSIKLKPNSAYAQTKFIAEKYIQFGIKSGMLGNIYRLGEIAPASDTGVPNQRALHHIFIEGCKTIKAYPQSSYKVDYLPVDFAANFIVKTIALENKKFIGKTFHLCHPTGVSFDKIFQLLTQRGLQAKSLDGLNFLRHLRQQSTNILEVATLKLFIERQKSTKNYHHNIFQSFFLKEMDCISIKNTKDLMKITKQTFPVIDDKMLSPYISFFKTNHKIYD